MKRILIALVSALALGIVSAAPASAAGPSLDVSQLATSACGSGKVVVNVVQGVRNDADSGVAGNAWAYDTYARQIVVVRTGESTFCAITRYAGAFKTLAGTSPSGTGSVSAGVVGALAGGYRTATFTAAFTPAKPVSGFLGTFDYACSTTFACPGRVDWTTWYFNSGAGASLDLAWWGWQYATRRNGTWINAITGNVGDITG